MGAVGAELLAPQPPDLDVEGGRDSYRDHRATVKDRQRCDGRELRRQADDNAPCLLSTEILPAQMIQKHAGRLPC